MLERYKQFLEFLATGEQTIRDLINLAPDLAILVAEAKLRQLNQLRENEFLLFAGVPGDIIATQVAEHLRMPLAKAKFQEFQGSIPGGGETKWGIEQNVRCKNCVIIWSVTDTDREIWRILNLIDTLVRNGAAQVHLVCPEYPYARQDKSHGKREGISAALLARLFAAVGLKSITYLDIHADQIEGFFYPVVPHGLWLDSIYIDYIARRMAALDNYYGTKIEKHKGLSLDEGGVKLVHRMMEKLKLAMAMHVKSRDYSEKHKVMSLGLAGKVKSCALFARDDLIASGDSYFLAADKAADEGAIHIIGFVTHALCFDKQGDEKRFFEKLRESKINELVVMNTLGHFQKRMAQETELREKITMLDITPLLATVIPRLLTGDKTIRDMMREIPAPHMYRELYTAEVARAYWDPVKMLAMPLG